jgi:FkbM family methyltransferase
MNHKALARFLYANVPGLAAVRFAAMDLLASNSIKPEYNGILSLCVGRGTIVDVGANRGQSIAAFKKLAPESQIIAFEPEPRAAKRLTIRYQHDQSVSVHACALGQQCGVTSFFIPKYGWWNCDGMAAGSRKAATEWLSDPGRMFLYNEAKLTVEEHRVECRTLDSYDLAPVLVKLHAQGAEPEILKGSIKIVRQYEPALMCAFPTIQLIELLSAWGYRPHVFVDGCFTPGLADRPITFTWFLTTNLLRRLPVSK